MGGGRDTEVGGIVGGGRDTEVGGIVGGCEGY